MKVTAKHLDKSRLGRLLVNRGYITEDQLQAALGRQRESGQRLGEVLISSGLISARDLSRTLKHQQRYRYAAAFAAAVVAPIQPLAAFAASAPATPAVMPPSASQQMRETGLKPLTDAEMQAVSGQGTEDFLADIQELQDAAEGKTEADPLDFLEVSAKTFFPAFALLDYDLQIKGVQYAAGGPLRGITQDGAIELALPERIESISLNNIRVSEGSASMGSIRMTDIRFSADSQITVRAR